MDITDLEGFNPSADWVNYGDVNPEDHGGLFLKWDPKWQCWEVVETYPLGLIDADEPLDSDRQYVTLGEVDVSDVFVGGDPSQGLTEDMKNVLESLGDEHFDPDNHPEHPTEYAPDFAGKISYYVADLGRERADQSRIESGDYQEILSKFDVDDWD